MEANVRINKSFSITSKEVGSDPQGAEWIEIHGYASRMFEDSATSNGSYVIDAQNENIDTFGIDLSRLQGGILPLLYNHDQAKCVGRVMEGGYSPDGLKVTARVYKLPGDDLTNYAYEAVKAGMLSAFSVGIIVKDFGVVEQDGEEYLQLAKSEIIELSLVAVPSNPKAVFRMTASGSEKAVSMSISKSAIKAENPNACEEFGQCMLEKQKELKVDKNQSTENNEASGNMPAEPETETVVEPSEPIEETPKEDLKEEVTVTEEVVEEEKPEEVTEEPTEDKEVTEPEAEEEKPEEVIEEVTEEQPVSFSDALDTLAGIDMEALSFEELETLHEFVAAVKDHVEAKVIEDVLAELKEGEA